MKTSLQILFFSVIVSSVFLSSCEPYLSKTPTETAQKVLEIIMKDNDTIMMRELGYASMGQIKEATQHLAQPVTIKNLSINKLIKDSTHILPVNEDNEFKVMAILHPKNILNKAIIVSKFEGEWDFLMFEYDSPLGRVSQKRELYIPGINLNPFHLDPTNDSVEFIMSSAPFPYHFYRFKVNNIVYLNPFESFKDPGFQFEKNMAYPEMRVVGMFKEKFRKNQKKYKDTSNSVF